MATTRQRASAGPDELAATLAGADFCHVVAHADADSLAAAGLVVRAAAATGTPYQLGCERTGDAVRGRLVDDEDTTTVAIGLDAPAADAAVLEVPATAAVVRALRRRDAPIDAPLALAGVLATGATPGTAADGHLRELAAERGITRRPGVSLAPVAAAGDHERRIDGLAHATLAHGPFSADRDAAAALVEGATGDAGAENGDADRRLASVVAIDATSTATDGALARAATAVERFLRPHALPDGPFATAEGYADVLEALARTAPAHAVALAAGRGDVEAALDAWRDHATAAHAAVRAAELARYSGLVTTTTDGPAWTVARLLRDYRASEPAVLAVGPDDVALATTDADARAVLAAATDGRATGRDRLAAAPTDDHTERDATALAERVRGSL